MVIEVLVCSLARLLGGTLPHNSHPCTLTGERREGACVCVYVCVHVCMCVCVCVCVHLMLVDMYAAWAHWVWKRAPCIPLQPLDVWNQCQSSWSPTPSCILELIWKWSLFASINYLVWLFIQMRKHWVPLTITITSVTHYNHLYVTH